MFKWLRKLLFIPKDKYTCTVPERIQQLTQRFGTRSQILEQIEKHELHLGHRQEMSPYLREEELSAYNLKKDKDGWIVVKSVPVSKFNRRETKPYDLYDMLSIGLAHQKGPERLNGYYTVTVGSGGNGTLFLSQEKYHYCNVYPTTVNMKPGWVDHYGNQYEIVMNPDPERPFEKEPYWSVI